MDLGGLGSDVIRMYYVNSQIINKNTTLEKYNITDTTKCLYICGTMYYCVAYLRYIMFMYTIHVLYSLSVLYI